MTTTAQRLHPEDPPEVQLQVLSGDPALGVGERAETSRHWLDAEAFVTRQLVADVTLDPVRLAATALLSAADADCVLVLAPQRDGGDLRTVIALGHRAEDVATHLHTGPSLLHRVAGTGEPVHLLDRRAPAPGRRPGVASMLLLALPRSTGDSAVLAAARFPDRPDFTGDDLAAAADFARHAGSLSELAAAHAARHQLDTIALRERIAADLQGQISRHVFSVGLTLDGVAAGLDAGPMADRIAAASMELDKVIAQVRESALAVANPSPASRKSLQARVLDVVAELTPALGFEPTLSLSGRGPATATSANTVEDVVAALRATLIDIARSAKATRATVALDISEAQLTLEVVDDSGREPSGSRVLWSIPTPEQPADGSRATWGKPA